MFEQAENGLGGSGVRSCFEGGDDLFDSAGPFEVGIMQGRAEQQERPEVLTQQLACGPVSAVIVFVGQVLDC